MNCHYFISDYFEIFKQYGLIKEMPIKDVDKSCCASNLNVIDFDYFKEELCKKLGVRTYKSADCLYIDKDKRTLYFIEMKSLEKLDMKVTLDDVKKFIKEKIKQKLDCSCFLEMKSLGNFMDNCSDKDNTLDKIKETITKKIDGKIECLYLSEMKELDDFINNRSEKTEINLENVKKFMQRAELNHKIEDSYILLLSAIGCHVLMKNVGLDSMTNQLKLKYIILVKISSRDYMKLKISKLDELWKQNFKFLSQAPNIIQENQLDNLIMKS